jgi:hypothetical protein
MESSTGEPSRRTVLQHTAALLGGVVGAAACGQAGTQQPAAGANGPAAAPVGGATMTLVGTGRTLVPPPVDGVVDTGAIAFGGDLLDAATGLEVGSFYAQALGRSGFPGGSAVGLEIQSLQLAGGALYAVGPAGSDRTERSYAVLGGTGRFTGARGTCVVREAPGGGVRRTLEFDISLA